MLSRFTDRANQVIAAARDEALALNHESIRPEHLLLGLLREEDGLAARVLGPLDITAEHIRDRILRAAGPAEEAPRGQIPFAHPGKQVLDGALREALALGQDHVGPEHLLLAIARQTEELAAHLLRDFGADAQTIRDDIVRLLSRPGGPAPARRPAGPRPGFGPGERGRLGVEYRLHVGLAPPVRRLLMVAAARALDAGRTETELTDVLRAFAGDDDAAALLVRFGVDAGSLGQALEQAGEVPPPASAPG